MEFRWKPAAAFGISGPMKFSLLCFFLTSSFAFQALASKDPLYLHCFKLLPPDLYVYRNSDSGKFTIVTGTYETNALRVHTHPKGTFLRFNDGFHTTDVELAVEFTIDPKADRDAEIYLSSNPNKIIDRYTCRPFRN
jgi:hypothetical protein